MHGQDLSRHHSMGPVIALALIAGASVWTCAVTLFQSALPVAVACSVFALVTLFALSGFARQRQNIPFGAANGITFFRAALIALVAAFAAEPPGVGMPAWWIAAAIAGTALLLDGVDGWVARRTARTTAFGARFDMEIDALAALVLCTVLWRAGLAGGWVLLVGGMRYIFVAAGWLLPWMRRPLPFRQRRRAVCAAQGFLLVASLIPVLPATAPPLLAFGALAATAVSFLIDTAWLYRHRANHSLVGAGQLPPGQR